MGVEPFLVSASVSGVLAQRLVRRICKYCREEYDPDLAQLPVDLKVASGQKLFRGAGCRDCRQSGYRGRIGIYEFLVVDDILRELIVQRKSAQDLLVAGRARGLKLMREDGWDKVLNGVTTVEEIARVTKIDTLTALA